MTWLGVSVRFRDAKKGAALYRGAVNVDPQPDKANSFIESIIANGRPYVKSQRTFVIIEYKKEQICLPRRILARGLITRFAPLLIIV